MDLGAFSISLPVQDLAASIDFYGTLVQWHEGVEAAFRAIVERLKA
mgnify:CR=1 FL=1